MLDDNIQSQGKSGFSCFTRVAAVIGEIFFQAFEVQPAFHPVFILPFSSAEISPVQCSKNVEATEQNRTLVVPEGTNLELKTAKTYR